METTLQFNALQPARDWLAPVRRALNSVFPQPEAVPAEHIDPGTGLLSLAGFLDRGNNMLMASRREEHDLCIGVFDFEDLLEVPEIYGNYLYRQARGRVVRKMQALAGKRGVAARTGRSQFAVVLPEYDPDDALLHVYRTLGSPTRVEMELDGEELVLVPDFQVRSTASSGSVGELLAEITDRLQTQREIEQRRCRHLQRERERHSRPSPLVEMLPGARNA